MSDVFGQRESNKMIRQSPYPLRSSRTIKDKAVELPVKSELEEVKCVICMEPPHNAVLLRCSSFLNGCRPYICNTSARHSNCLKQFLKSFKNKRSKVIKCPLCRGNVSEKTKMTSAARRFLNAKERSCPNDDCEFTGTYSKLNKHLRTEHRGIVPSKVDPQRQRSWEQVERDAFDQLMSPFMANHHQVFNIPIAYPQTFQVNVNGTMLDISGPSQVRTGFGPNNYATTLMPRLHVGPRLMYGDWRTL